MSRDVFRVSVIGTGAIAQVVHLPTLSQLPGVRVVSLCDIDTSKSQALANRFGIGRTCRSEADVFADPEVDGVVICAPSIQHEPLAIAALEAGKHVLVEKPLALTADGAARVIEAAEKADRTLMVAMNNRYRPDVVALKPFLSGGELGEIFFMKGAALNRKVRHVRPTWRHTPAMAGGGALMDLGVQTLDLCLWLLDYPPVRRVHAYGHTGEGMEVEDSALVTLELGNGCIVYIEVTWSLQAQRDRHYVQLLASEGSAAFPPLAVSKEVEQGLIDVTPPIGGAQGNLFTAAYREQLRDFVATARGGKPRTLPREQIRLMRLVELAYESIRERRDVKVEA